MFQPRTPLLLCQRLRSRAEPATAPSPESRLAIQGQPPDLARLPPGCAFAPRCQHADAQCSASRPLLRTLEPGHLAACHHDHAIDAVLQPPQAHAA